MQELMQQARLLATIMPKLVQLLIIPDNNSATQQDNYRTETTPELSRQRELELERLLAVNSDKILP